LILGFASMAYWGSNGFIPDYLKATDRAQFIAPSLSVLNLSQFPSSLLVALLSRRLLSSRVGFVAAGAVLLIGFVGLVITPGPWPIAAAGVVGLASALVFVMGLALPPLLAAPNEVHRLAAAMFTITYSFSFSGPVIGGALWDTFHVPALAFLPATLGSVAMALLALALRLPRQTGFRQAAEPA
jgi:CP family cyanate transporter-like MFS transporter